MNKYGTGEIKFRHGNGRNLAVLKRSAGLRDERDMYHINLVVEPKIKVGLERCEGLGYGAISEIGTHNRIFADVGGFKGQIGKCSNDQIIYTIENDQFSSVAISDDFIVMDGWDFKIYVHEIRDGYNL